MGRQRARVTEAEIADLMAPAPIACTAWLRPIRDYDRRQDMQRMSFVKFG
jgi:hypothetical protein